MSCSKALSFATTSGAHLSLYWTMDEGGVADKVDSTVGLHWPLQFGASGLPGLFSNGTNMPPNVVLSHNPGLAIFGTGAITINQAISKGLSAWWWIKLNAYGPEAAFFILDTDDVMHTNRFRAVWGFSNALTGAIEVGHTNDTDDVFADSPNLPWALGAWHMVAITYDKVAQTLNLYVDGVLSATAPDAFTYPDLTTTDFILWQLGQGTATLNETVDEFGLCLNGALTPAQVTALYNGGAGLTWPNITPIVPYP